MKAAALASALLAMLACAVTGALTDNPLALIGWLAALFACVFACYVAKKNAGLQTDLTHTLTELAILKMVAYRNGAFGKRINGEHREAA